MYRDFNCYSLNQLFGVAILKPLWTSVDLSYTENDGTLTIEKLVYRSIIIDGTCTSYFEGFLRVDMDARRLLDITCVMRSEDGSGIS